MVAINYARALAEIEKGKIDRAYLLLGEENYQRFLLTDKIIAARLRGEERLYNKHIVSGNKATPTVLQEMLAGVPMFGAASVVIVTDLGRLPEASQSLLLKLLRQPEITSTFIGTASKLDGRTKFAKGLQAVATTVELKTLYDDAAPAYVQSRFLARSISIDRKAAEKFCEIVGSDCGDIENEVEKISIIFADRRTVTADDISSYLSAAHSVSQWAVAQQLAERDVAHTLASAHSFLESAGSDGRGRLFWALYQQFERILICQTAGNQMADSELAARMRMHPFHLRALRQQSSRYTPAEAANSLLAIYAAEVEDRFQSESRERIFERLFLKLLSKSGE